MGELGFADIRWFRFRFRRPSSGTGVAEEKPREFAGTGRLVACAPDSTKKRRRFRPASYRRAGPRHRLSDFGALSVASQAGEAAHEGDSDSGADPRWRLGNHVHCQTEILVEPGIGSERQDMDPWRRKMRVDIARGKAKGVDGRGSVVVEYSRGIVMAADHEIDG